MFIILTFVAIWGLFGFIAALKVLIGTAIVCGIIVEFL